MKMFTETLRPLTTDDLALLGINIEQMNPENIDFLLRIDLSVEDISKRIKFLKELGFKNTVPNIQDYPLQTLKYTKESDVLEKIETLQNYCEDKESAIICLDNQPQLFIVNTQDLVKRLDFLKNNFGILPEKIIRNAPSLLGNKSEIIGRKMGKFNDLGITDPGKMINSTPQTLSLGIDNLVLKIETFQKLYPGISIDTVVSKFPAFLTYSNERFIRFDAFFNDLIEEYNLPYKTKDIIERMPQILSYSEEKISMTVILIERLDVPDAKKKTLLIGLITKNITDLMYAFLDDTVMDIKSLRKSLREVTNQRKSEEKSSLSSDDKMEEIKRRRNSLLEMLEKKDDKLFVLYKQYTEKLDNKKKKRKKV